MGIKYMIQNNMAHLKIYIRHVWKSSSSVCNILVSQTVRHVAGFTAMCLSRKPIMGRRLDPWVKVLPVGTDIDTARLWIPLH